MGKLILIADDEVDIIRVIKYRIIKQGYKVIMANNGQEAVDQARQHHPDLIIMDFRMPVLNGLEATKIIKADDKLKHVPVILLTASSATVSADMVRQAGVAQLVHKPFEADELMGTIQQLLGN